MSARTIQPAAGLVDPEGAQLEHARVPRRAEEPEPRVARLQAGDPAGLDVGGHDHLGAGGLRLQALQAVAQHGLARERGHHHADVGIHHSTRSRLRPGPKSAPTASPQAQLTRKVSRTGAARTNAAPCRRFRATVPIMRPMRSGGNSGVAAA